MELSSEAISDGTDPPPIEPDTKDWTWVIAQGCPECGWQPPLPTEVATRVQASIPRWTAVLSRPDAAVRRDPSHWSALEYGCHVRDVFRIFRTRLELILGEDDPVFPNWDQDETALQDRYAEQDRADVRRELLSAAERLAAAFEDVPAAGWQRPGRRSDGAVFTLTTFSQYLVHDPVHHLWDVTHPTR